MIEQRLIHGRHTGHRGNFRACDRRQGLLRIETGQHDDFPAALDGAVEHRAVRENVEKGQNAHHPVNLVNEGIDVVDLTRVGGQVLVGAHRALGRAGGAAGILQQGDIPVCTDFRRFIIAIIPDQIGKGSDPVIIGNRAALVAAKQ